VDARDGDLCGCSWASALRRLDTEVKRARVVGSQGRDALLDRTLQLPQVDQAAAHRLLSLQRVDLVLQQFERHGLQADHDAAYPQGTRRVGEVHRRDRRPTPALPPRPFAAARLGALPTLDP
jgi:hypothetical protein